jgi:tetraacyldisaccharide 4'-kinase
LYFLWRGIRNRAWFRTLPQRLGFLPRSFRQTVPGAIWLHAVSVGEVLAAPGLLRRLREEFPRSPVFVSTSTLAGRATAHQKLRGLAAGVFYAPLDYVFAVRRVLRTLRPSLVIVMETEIWPNLFRETARIHAPLLIVNGRISDRAARRYFAWSWFFAHVLRWPARILAQSEVMRERFIRAGAPPGIVEVSGNLKYDFEPREAGPDSAVRRWLDALRPARVWIAASTMPPARAGDIDEDDAVIRAFEQLAPKEPGLLLIVAPRRPERFDPAGRKLAAAGIRAVRRSALEQAHPPALPAVLLLDTIGELSGLFACADAVFLGGSLAERGGHNILEPAFFSKPVVIGPHMENFADIAAEFRAAGACVQIGDAADLAPAVAALLRDPPAASAIGRKALACALARRGVSASVAAELARFYRRAIPCYRPAWPQYGILRLLAAVWLWAGGRRRGKEAAHRRRIEPRTVSAGNITMGGTGKTPLVLYLAERARQAGRRPGILTRGYGRAAPQRIVVLEAGARVPVALSGDEPQIYLRAAVAPVGLGADRYRVGKLLAEDFATDLLLLDDGFQHLRLERDLDIVLIDALNPFGGGEIFPLGRLREPLDSLARADVFVITRAEHARLLDAIEHRLRLYQPRAPVFHARLVPEHWVEYATGARLGPGRLPFQRVGAFCGLGNPDSFWATLAALDLDPVERVAFSDHHVYRPREIRRLADHFRHAGAQAVVTTEKDTFNLCEGCSDLLAPLPLYWLQVRMALDREDEFWHIVDRDSSQDSSTH